MSFEVYEHDLLGRTGRIETKSGAVETPAFFPVVNPRIKLITASELYSKFRFRAIMTNAYLVMKSFGEEASTTGIHRLLEFPGVIMTDSGAYQSLVYGKVEADWKQMAAFQERISTDIAVILDEPTGWTENRAEAERSVNETIERARRTLGALSRNDILWVGPVQGGLHYELVAQAACEMSTLPFPMYALGSPTRVMEQYYFDVLVHMIMAAKMHLPLDRPLHLFGAGHPMVFPFVVALGCDTFDSAAYAMFARDSRYMTAEGTWKVEELESLPCPCPACSAYSAAEVKGLRPDQRERFLAEHNLHVCQAEMERVRLAVIEGRLWELLESRARGHPALLKAFQALVEYGERLERFTPVTKPRGTLFLSELSRFRPEVLRHAHAVTEKYRKPKEAKVLMLIPAEDVKPFDSSKGYSLAKKALEEFPQRARKLIHICFYGPPYGVVPVELSDVFPLSQFEAPEKFGPEWFEHTLNAVGRYLRSQRYTRVVLIYDSARLSRDAVKALERAFNVRTLFSEGLSEEKKTLSRLRMELKRVFAPIGLSPV